MLGRWVLGCGLLFGLVGCSEDAEVATSSIAPTTELTTAEPTTAPTTAEPTTTVAPTTTEPITTGPVVVLRWNTQQQAVVDVGTTFWDLIVRNINADVLDPDDPDYPMFVTGPALELMLSNSYEHRDAGLSTEGEGFITTISVDMRGDEATLVQCTLDAIDTLDAAGNVIEPADLEPTVWQSTLERSEGQWRVATFFRVQERTCELDPDDQYVIHDRPWLD